MDSPKIANIGLQQGRVFSPILYTICTADTFQKLPIVFRNLQYANDAALWLFMPTKNAELDMPIFENAINNIGIELQKVGLEIQPEKTKLVCFSKKNTTELKVSVSGKKICTTPSAKFLGIIFDFKLSFSSQIKKVQKKQANH